MEILKARCSFFMYQPILNYSSVFCFTLFLPCLTFPSMHASTTAFVIVRQCSNCHTDARLLGACIGSFMASEVVSGRWPRRPRGGPNPRTRDSNLRRASPRGKTPQHLSGAADWRQERVFRGTKAGGRHVFAGGYPRSIVATPGANPRF